MTREDILKEYTVDSHGIIRTLGKFEAEPLCAPYFKAGGKWGTSQLTRFVRRYVLRELGMAY